MGTAADDFLFNKRSGRIGGHAIPLAFGLCAAGIVALAAIVFYLLNRTLESDALVFRSADTIAQVERLHQRLFDAESTGRAFIISGQQQFRESFATKTAEVDDGVRELRHAVAHEPEQRARLARIEGHVDRRFAYLDALVSLRASKGIEAAQRAAIGTGVAEMQAINSLLTEMKRTERNYLQARLAMRRQHDQALAVSLGILVLSGLALIGTLFWRMRSMWAQKEKAEAHAIHLAHHDVLTRLPNRRLLADRLALEVAHAGRASKHCAVLCLDLDGFKTVNDNHGHAAGDELLRLVADRLRLTLRAEDTIARLGGDEFAVVLPHLEKAELGELVAAKIISAVSVPYRLGPLAVTVGTSVGIAVYPTDPAAALVERADEALYAAKRTGKGTYVQLARGARQGGQRGCAARALTGLAASLFCPTQLLTHRLCGHARR